MSSFGAPLRSVLSEREREVIRLTAAGFTDAAVGEKLGLAAETVRSHWKRVRKRLGGVTRSEVIRFLAHEEGNPYREVFEWLQAPVVYGDAEGRYLDVNPALLELVGFSREEMLGRSFIDFVPPDATGMFKEAWADVLRTNRWEGEFPILRKDGLILRLYWRSRRAPETGRLISVGFHR
ncbi:MAG: PAS domain S-box protein [Fimbriimonas sp.]